MNICSQCLEIIPDDELCFDGFPNDDNLPLCRLCFYANPYISDKMKREFAYYEGKEIKNGED